MVGIQEEDRLEGSLERVVGNLGSCDLQNAGGVGQEDGGDTEDGGWVSILDEVLVHVGPKLVLDASEEVVRGLEDVSDEGGEGVTAILQEARDDEVAVLVSDELLEVRDEDTGHAFTLGLGGGVKDAGEGDAAALVQGKALSVGNGVLSNIGASLTTEGGHDVGNDVATLLLAELGHEGG